MTNTALPQPPIWYRWTVLAFISLAMFGNYYLYDSLAPVADLLKEGLGFTETQYGWLAGAYSWAAIAFLIFGGLMVDRLGTKKSTMIFAVICVVAGFLMIASSQYWVMVLSRVLLGIGAEPLIVAVSAAIAKWFKGKELSFALGINLLVARLGQILADWSPTWARAAYDNWRDPLVLGALLGLTCVLGAVLYWMMESRAEAKYSLGEAGASDKLVLADLFRFNRSFWFITALCVAFYSVVFPFRSFAIKFFIEAHQAERDFAGQLNSVLPFAAMIATPLFGLLVDRIGRRASLMAVGTLLLVPVFPILAYTRLTLYLPVTMLGIAFSLIPAIMWPSVAYLVDQRRLGSAYALMFLLQQAGVAGLDWLVGRLNDFAGAGAAHPTGYLPMLWTFTVLGVMALGFAFLLWRAETSDQGHGLETIKVGGTVATS
ncbi:MAG: MFS transporter [Acidobacteria bacterium]|nr:MFS transporter [Acidobacteriota bacterium]